MTTHAGAGMFFSKAWMLSTSVGFQGAPRTLLRARAPSRRRNETEDGVNRKDPNIREHEQYPQREAAKTSL